MRWIVEVSSVGRADKHTYCVESESWQRALQLARTLREDHGPMTGFSIELLDDGFSAVDPMTRLRYFVKRAADDAPLTALPPGVSAKTSSIPPAARAQPAVVVPPPAPTPTPATVPTPPPAAAVEKKKPNLSKTFVFGSTGAAMLAEAKDAQAQAQAHPPPPRPATTTPSVTPAPAKPLEPKPVPRPVSAAPAPVLAQPPPPAPARAAPAPIVTPPTLPGIDLLHKREHDPDEASPLTYREYVYFFPAASNETMARAMLVAQFDIVRASLEGAKPGKLVNLAIFEVTFQGRPSVPPVVTLSWKDWKGEPAIEFPRRKANGPSASAPPPVAVAAPAAAPPAAQVAPPAPAPTQTPVPVPVPVPAPVVVPAPSPQGHSTQPSAGVVLVPADPTPPQKPPPLGAAQAAAAAPAPEPAGFPPPRVVEPEPAPARPPPPAVVEPSVVVAPSVLSPEPKRPPSQPPSKRGSKPNVRLRGDELIADLFEAMHDLHFLRDAVEGADFCLTLAIEKIPSRVGLVHLYDIDRREFVVACARGPNQEVALLQRYPENDPILAKAMRAHRAILFNQSNEVNRLERYAIFGGAASLVVAPVILAGRFLGAIELMDPADGSPFSEDEGHALTYIGEQFAEFVATRGVTVDPERIATSARG